MLTLLQVPPSPRQQLSSIKASQCISELFCELCRYTFIFIKKIRKKFGSKKKYVIFAYVILKTIFLP